MIWLVAAAIVALVGAGLLTAGARGRRLDDHPICGGCGFDLVGVYPVTQRCPECGAELSERIALRFGNRRVRRVPAVLGVACLVLGLFGGSAAGWAMSTGFDWITVKPAWLLMRELRGEDVAARDELLRRHREDLLSPRHRAQLIEQAIAIHGDPASIWDREWERFLQRLVDDDVLSDEQIRRILRQMVGWEARPRERIHADMAVPVFLGVWPQRAPRFPPSRDYVAQPFLSRSIDEVRINGEAVSMGMLQRSIGYGTFTADQVGRSTATIPIALESSLPPGEHTIEITMTHRLRLDPAHGMRLEAELTGTTRSRFEMVPEDVVLVRGISSPEIDEQMRSAVKLREVQIRGRSPDSVMLLAMFELDQPPLPLVMQLYVRDSEGQVRPLHGYWFTASAGERSGHYPLVLSIRNPPARGDLILRCDHRHAIYMPGVEEYWDGEIIFPDFLPVPED